MSRRQSAPLDVKLPNGKSIEQLIGFGPQLEKNAAGAADVALQQGTIQMTDTRELVAAAALAYAAQPEGFYSRAARSTPQEILWKQIVDSIEAGARSVPAIEEQIASVAKHKTADERHGEDLSKGLRGVR